MLNAAYKAVLKSSVGLVIRWVDADAQTIMEGQIPRQSPLLVNIILHLIASVFIVGLC